MRDNTVRYGTLRVKRREYVTATDIQAGVRSTLQVLVELGVARELAAITGISEGTIYRHGRPPGAKNRPGRMDADIFRTVADLFLDLGILEAPNYEAIREAVDEVRRRAKEAADDLDGANEGDGPGAGGGRRRGGGGA